MTQTHPHMPWGRLFQTEHFNLLVKRCRICDEFIGVETEIRSDVKQEEPTPEPIQEGNPDVQ